MMGSEKVGQFSKFGRSAGLALLVLGLSIFGDAVAQPSDAVPQVTVRKSTDGAGPSNILAIGSYILVVDPLEARITRFATTAFGANMERKFCTFDRDFAPWRSVAKPNGTWLVSEDQETAMFLTPASVDAFDGGDCPKPAKADNAATAPPTFIAGATSAVVSLNNPAGPTRLKIDAHRSGSIIDARILRTLADGRSIVFWKRLEALPVDGKDGDNAASYKAQGRVFVALFVTVFDRNARILSQNRVLDFSFVEGKDGVYEAAYHGMKKRGFEFLAADQSGALYGLTSAGSDFVVKRFVLAGSDGAIALAGSSSVADNQGDVSEIVATEPEALPKSKPGKWKKALDDAAAAFINVEWQLPIGAANSPCGQAEGKPIDRCQVMYRDERLTVRSDSEIAAGNALAVLNETAIAEWGRPSQLIGRPDGYIWKGVPYSYGGDSAPDALRDFPAHKPPRKAYAGTPFGHIVELLTIRGGREYKPGTYPFGIDCSRFVARLLAAMGGTKTIVPENGTEIAIPDGWFATPVEHAGGLLPGDILIKDGHVVIFVRTVDGGTSQRGEYKQGNPRSAIGYVVYEATSRCGRVCKSTYGLDFFNGWWMLRPKAMAAADMANPYGVPTWVSRKVARTYPAPKKD